MDRPFDAKEYRAALARSVGEIRAEYMDSMRTTDATDESTRLLLTRDDRRQAMRRHLQKARLEEGYHRARLENSPRALFDVDGERRHPYGRLTAKELVEVERIRQALEWEDLERCIHLAQQAIFSSEILKSDQFSSLAERMLWRCADEGTDIFLDEEQARRLRLFARLFGQERVLKNLVMRQVEHHVKHRAFSVLHRLTKLYPFVRWEDCRAMLDAQMYPLPRGLREELLPETLVDRFATSPKDTHFVELAPDVWRDYFPALAYDIASQPSLYKLLKRAMDDLFISKRGAIQQAGAWRVQRLDRPRSSSEAPLRLSVCYSFIPDEVLKGNDAHIDYERYPALEVVYTVDRAFVELDTSVFIDASGFFTTKGYRPESVVFVQDEERCWVWGNKKEEGVRDQLSRPMRLPRSSLETFAHVLLDPLVDGRVSAIRFEKLAEMHAVSPELASDISRAIREFRAYMYRNDRSSVGDCLITPQRFSTFCMEKFGHHPEIARYGEYHPEWGGERGYAPYTFYHAVNVVGGAIVIDWTATQFNKNYPIPLVYEIGDQRYAMGPLYKETSQNGCNELFISDPTHSMYREAPPVTYGI